MVKQLLRGWKVVPLWLKVAPMIVLLAGLPLLQAYLEHHRPDLVPLMRHAYYLPLFMASVLFGLRGGLLCALAISFNFFEDVVGQRSVDLTQRLYMAAGVGVYFLVGGVTGFLVDREKREAQRLKHMQEMAALGQAAAALAHEMKTPLIAIGGFAQQIYRTLEDDHPHRAKLKIIVDQVAHMEQLMREVLDYVRPMQLRLERAYLREVVEEARSLASLFAEQSGVSLELELPPQPVEALIDKGRLRQVLLNLMQNAIQASPRGARVIVSTAREGDFGLITVGDQGCGIAAEDLARIFNPFFTTKRQGTGLGLAVAQKIVQAHGGGIESRSAPGQGSSFTVRLPLAGPAEPTAPAA